MQIENQLVRFKNNIDKRLKRTEKKLDNHLASSDLGSVSISLFSVYFYHISLFLYSSKVLDQYCDHTRQPFPMELELPLRE